MDLVKCKTIAVNDNTGRHVNVELRGPSFWNGSYKVRLSLTGEDWEGTVKHFNKAQGEYILMLLAYENFGEEQAKHIAKKTDNSNKNI